MSLVCRTKFEIEVEYDPNALSYSDMKKKLIKNLEKNIADLKWKLKELQ